MRPYLRDLQSDATVLLKQVSQWIVAGVETSIFWPKIPQVVPFNGKDFILRPGTKDHLPSIALNARQYNLDRRLARDEVLSFASALAWMGKNRLEIVGWAGGNFPTFVGRGNTQTITDFLDPTLIDILKSDDDKTILAFFREAVSSRNPFYAFLNFYKVIEFAVKDGKKRGPWLTEALTHVPKGRPLERLEALKVELAGNDISNYLYEEGRHAIAHAKEGIFVNPDRLGDLQRIEADLPLMQALAQMAIEKFHGLKAESYDLQKARRIAGFSTLFGADIINQIQESQTDKLIDVPTPNFFTLVARRGAETAALEHFQFIRGGFGDGKVGILCANDIGSINIEFHVDFRNKTLDFDPLGMLDIHIDPNNLATIEAALLAKHFEWCMIRNGRLEVWNDDNDLLLGCSEPFVPVNMEFNPDGHQADIDQLTKVRDALQQQETNPPATL